MHGLNTSPTDTAFGAQQMHIFDGIAKSHIAAAKTSLPKLKPATVATLVQCFAIALLSDDSSEAVGAYGRFFLPERNFALANRACMTSTDRRGTELAIQR